MPVSASSRVAAASPSTPHIIIDTDFSKWWDDVTALGIANVLHERGKLKLLGIVSDVPNPVAVAAIDAIDTAYGHAGIPIGAVAASDAGTFDHGYTDTLAAKLPHSITDSSDTPDAVALYRRLLSRAPDHSVTIVALGGYTNLAGLLHGAGGPKLITQKVKRLVIMDGLFPGGIGPVTNQKIDLAAANAVVERPGVAGPDLVGRRHGRHRDPGRRVALHDDRGRSPDAHRLRGAVRVRSSEGRRLGRTDAALRGR